MASKKVLCSNKSCRGVIAHQISPKTFEVKHQGLGVTMTGSSWSSMATCPLNQNHQTSIVVNDGEVDTSALRYKDDTEQTGENTEEE